MSDPRRRPVRPDRVRTIPRSFAWIDREFLTRERIFELSREAVCLYFLLALVAGPEGTSFWSHARLAGTLQLSVDELLGALRELIGNDLVAFRYPTYQVLSLRGAPPR